MYPSKRTNINIIKTATRRDVVTGKRGKENSCLQFSLRGEQRVGLAPSIFESNLNYEKSK